MRHFFSVFFPPEDILDQPGTKIARAHYFIELLGILGRKKEREGKKKEN